MPKPPQRPSSCPPWIEIAVVVLSIAATAIEMYRRRNDRSHGKSTHTTNPKDMV
jgi:hypothetical protein